MKQQPLTHGVVPLYKYPYPHGASNPMEASLKLQQANSLKQHELIHHGGGSQNACKHCGRKLRKHQYKKATKKHTKKHTKKAIKRRTHNQRTHKNKVYYGGSGLKPLQVPTFDETNAVSPVNGTSLSVKTNSILLQNQENAKFDHLTKAPPIQVSSFN